MSTYMDPHFAEAGRDDPPEPEPTPREVYDREVEQFLREHYDDGVNYGGEG